jgi:hypothetical protein
MNIASEAKAANVDAIASATLLATTKVVINAANDAPEMARNVASAGNGALTAAIEEIAANGVTGAQSEVSKAVSARPVRRELEWNDTESKSVTTMASDRAISSVP